MMMNKLENWKEVTRGIYRYVIAAKVAYEIHVNYWVHFMDILTSQCSLYLVGEWLEGESTVFERETLLECGTLQDCLDKAVEDDRKNNVH